jgi:YbgC/YbaW family acyl-CoA thioester hydrolase
MAYVQRLRVRFDEVDFARIVYYPRLFGYCHWVFEDFFAAEAGMAYSEVLQKRRIGFPVVSAKADFRSPLRFGDTCRISMEAIHLGRRSLACRYRLYLGETEQLCAEIEVTAAVISMDDFTPVDLPADFRALLEKHRAAPPPQG